MAGKRLLLTVLAMAAVGIAVGGWATKPAPLSPAPPQLVIPAAIDDYLREKESAEHALVGVTEGAEKRVVWAGEPGQRSDYVLVYFHGFSATRQEIAPVPELVAQALGANLFETRLAGHGREREQLSGISAEDWMNDGAEALAVAKALGEKIVLMGTSTGATLALAMARHPDFASVDSLILVSPNFGPAGKGSGITTGPFGPQLARLILGERRSWVAANDLQEKYWSTDYPTASIVEMMRLVNLSVELTPEAKSKRAMLVYSPKDDVVSVSKLLAGFERLPAGQKKVHAVDEPRSLSPHVLTGDILAPGTSEETAALISAFIAGA
ncbi:alpha/beta hydrolase [Congregibacter litoralis]|uniref:Alpha/beta hydrolase family n=1 Tax=Congregibacter litoralis KT71 TaxID=314285 RepID=A4A8S9_9GAMM|nr:alpha/beta fold hydrolase [Congregibacter litoralis]EAQ97471.2 Alpha/beta hydrolase family [Congregibacter litoralis KT71]